MERVVRNRNGFPLLLAAIGMVVLLVGCGVASNSAALGSAANPVPWISTKGTSQGSATVQATRACRAADLSVKAGRSGAYHGLATQEVLLTNQGQEACFLPGPPAAVAILNDGSRRQATVSSSAAVATRIDLAVGQTATLLLGTPGTCPGVGHPQVASRVELTLSTGEKLSAQRGERTAVTRAAKDTTLAACYSLDTVGGSPAPFAPHCASC